MGASLVLLFDCPNLLPTFGPDFRPLLPAFIIPRIIHVYQLYFGKFSFIVNKTFKER